MRKIFLGLMKGVETFVLFLGKGILALIPIWVISWLFGFVWGGGTIILREVLISLLEKIPGITVKGWMVNLSLISVVLLIGAFSSPVFKRIYSWIGLLIQYAMWKRIEEQGQMVVVFEYFRENLWALGIVTGSLKKSGHLERGRVLKMFSPSIPIPITAPALLYLQEKDVIKTSIPVDEVVNSFISGGLLAPQEIPELVAELERREMLSERDRQRLIEAAK